MAGRLAVLSRFRFDLDRVRHWCRFGGTVGWADLLPGYNRNARFGAPLTGLTTRVVADALWGAYKEGRPTSISAFPSLHVAIPALYVAAMWRTRLRWPALLFWALTLLGSIGLLWHYAVDSYAGTLGVLGCWWITGKLVTPPPR